MGKNKKFKSFESLEVWQHCQSLKRAYYHLAQSLPKEEKYRLTDQIIRCSRSVTNNIAEGWGRFHYQENIQFCRESRGSLYELLDHLHDCKDCRFIAQNGQYQQLRTKTIQAIQLLNGYIRYLKQQKDSSK